MAGLDPNIILQSGHPSVELADPTDLATKNLAYQTAALQNRQLQRQAQDQQDLRNAYTQALTKGPDGTPTIDRQKLMGALQSNPQQMVAEGQKFNAQDAAMNDQRLKIMNDHIQARKVALNQIPTGADVPQDQKQPAWTGMLKGLSDAGMDTSMYPAQYPGDKIVGSYQATLLSAEEKLAQHNKTIDQQTASRKNDIEAYAAGMPAAGGAKAAPVTPDTDPATLINQQVRKDQRKDVGDEIKNRQDVVSLKPQILAAFDMANTRDPIVSAQGQHAFQSLIGTTVKDKEDSARASAFQLIHDNMAPKGTMALPGDNDARRKNVIDYLGSKASSPLAKANGINLDHFSSTNLNDGAVNMRAPDGTIRKIPLAKVKDALAAGGKEI